MKVRDFAVEVLGLFMSIITGLALMMFFIGSLALVGSVLCRPIPGHSLLPAKAVFGSWVFFSSLYLIAQIRFQRQRRFRIVTG